MQEFELAPRSLSAFQPTERGCSHFVRAKRNERASRRGTGDSQSDSRFVGTPSSARCQPKYERAVRFLFARANETAWISNALVRGGISFSRTILMPSTRVRHGGDCTARTSTIFRAAADEVQKAIFTVFFAHRLFRALDVEAHEHGYAPGWNANSQATLYVSLAIVSSLTFRLSNSVNAGTVFLLLSLGLGLASAVPLFAAQKVANLAAGDVQGRSNASITAGNCVVILIGLLLWATVALGLFVGPARAE
jgi:hypothetical protein